MSAGQTGEAAACDCVGGCACAQARGCVCVGSFVGLQFVLFIKHIENRSLLSLCVCLLVCVLFLIATAAL